MVGKSRTKGSGSKSSRTARDEEDDVVRPIPNEEVKEEDKYHLSTEDDGYW